MTGGNGDPCPATVDWFLARLAADTNVPALICGELCWTRGQLLDAVTAAGNAVDVSPGDVVMLHSGLSHQGVAMLLALAHKGAIVAPLVPSASVEAERLQALCGASVVVSITQGAPTLLRRVGKAMEHSLYSELRAQTAAGLVIFTSGSSGTPKAVVHHLGRLLDKFKVAGTAARTLAFLMFDHIGGINTLLQTLANGGTLVIPTAHDPETVAATVARHKIELLPVSPSFLNLLILSGANTRHDLSSLRLISYGTEPMPPATLRRVADALPAVRLHQLYGLSEVGILRSRVRDSDASWVELGGTQVQTRVVDGMLQVKAPTAMLGYLNAPSPFTSDGWLMTGDEVDVDGPWVRIKGRRSEIINVGGQKVFPAEVEAVVGAMENILDVVVFGLPHALLGQVVACRVNLVSPEEPDKLRARIRIGCRQQLAPFKAPVKIEVTQVKLHGDRHKKSRPDPSTSPGP